MRRMLAVVLLVPAASWAAERPNTLTPKEIAEGWISLFDGETTFGWAIDGEAKVEKGVLVLGGAKETKARVSCEFASYDVQVKMDVQGKSAAKARIGVLRVGSANTSGDFESSVGGRAVRPRPPVELTIPAGTTVRIHRAALQPAGLSK